MSKRPVTVVIPMYKAVAFLPQLIGALELLDPWPSEIIFVDDCSPDDTATEIDRLLGHARLQGRCRVIRRATNGGSSAARNDGLDAATGDIVAFCDADDLPMPGRVGAHLRDLASTPEGGLSFGAIAGFIDGSDHAIYVRGGWRYREGERPKELVRRNYVPFSTVALCGSGRDLRFGSDRYNEDWLYIVEQARRVPFRTERRVMTAYRYSATQKTQGSMRPQILDALAEMEKTFSEQGERRLARAASSTARTLRFAGRAGEMALFYRELMDYVPARCRGTTEVDRVLRETASRGRELQRLGSSD